MRSKTLLNVEGMTCANCALGIEKKLKKRGLDNIMIDVAGGEVTFELIDDVKIEDAVDDIKSLGYKVKDQSVEDKPRFTSLERKFFICALLTLPLFLHMFIPWPLLHHPLVQLLLSLPVMIIGWGYFGKSAINSLQNKLPNMDVLITMGSSAAFIYSLIGLVLYYGTEKVGDFLFFETAATIITLVLLGNVIEHRSVKKTTQSIKELSKLQKIPARLIVTENDTEKFEIVDAEKLNLNDLMQVNSGDRIASDGLVLEGSANVDESMISGESLPVQKSVQDAVIGGTLITDGSLRIKVTAVKDKTVLSQIIELVKQSRSAKPKIQLLGDRVSAVFVPVVIGIAMLTAALWIILTGDVQKALLSSIAVLVISCPCAMGLATPTAVSVGLGRAARNGILIKGGDTVEKIAQLKTIVFDKTGTLTTGQFKIESINMYSGMEQEVKSVLLRLEQHSSHSIAKSIVNELQQDHTLQAVSLLNPVEEKGIGIYAKDNDGNTYFAGSAKRLNSKPQIKHDVYVTKNDLLLAGINLKDEIKPNSKNVFHFLKGENIKSLLLSGDRTEKVKYTADELKIDQYYAEQLPQQKLDIIKAENQIALTAMVGDGINDAPSLSQASVGISLSNATQVAIDSSEVIIISDHHMETFKKAIQIGKETYLTIKQNLFWAFFYNIVAIPAAAFGYLSPLIAALGMAFSDIVVIGNSLRLRYKKIFR